MAASNERHLAYKPTTIFRSVLLPEERKLKKICTVWPEPISLPHPAFGTHATIPGRPPKGEPQLDAFYVPRDGSPRKLTDRYGFTLAPPSVERDDLGNVRTLSLLSISSRRTAMDVIGLADAGMDEQSGKQYCPAITTSDLFEKGYFVPEGDDPTEAELEAAESRLDKWLRKALAKGDRIWNNTQKLDAIPPEALTAAQQLRESRPWALSGTGEKRRVEFVACPVCHSEIEKGVRKCVSCNEWLGYDPDGTIFAVNDPDRKRIAKGA